MISSAPLYKLLTQLKHHLLEATVTILALNFRYYKKYSLFMHFGENCILLISVISKLLNFYFSVTVGSDNFDTNDNHFTFYSIFKTLNSGIFYHFYCFSFSSFFKNLSVDRNKENVIFFLSSMQNLERNLS